MNVSEAQAHCQAVLDAVSGVIVGKADVLSRVMAGILANGHILIEDYPGLAKTLIGRLFAQALDLDFKRIQFTPDLMPSDITGSAIYDQKTSSFEFRRGPVFTNLLLADEINRATPKAQSALLEAMQEGQVTSDGNSYQLDQPFLVIATQNPIDLEGTYALPEAQLDRFLMRVGVGYPERAEETAILKRRREWRQETAEIPKIVSRTDLLALQQVLEGVHVEAAVEAYIVDLVRATRAEPRVALGASPRGSLSLMKLARAEAVLHRRDFVTPDDVKTMAAAALAHRIVVRPELWSMRISAAQLIDEILSRVPTPVTERA
jgi:MoxR-like ATPase